MQYINQQNKDFQAYKQTLKLETKKDTLALNNKQKDIEKSINDFEEKFIADHKGTYIADVMNLKSEKLLKDIPKASNGRPDSIQVYNYYKKHYWDNVDFKDDGIIRNPFFNTKIKQLNLFLSIFEINCKAAVSFPPKLREFIIINKFVLTIKIINKRIKYLNASELRRYVRKSD